MRTFHTSSHIRTHKVLRSFRSCVNATGKAQIIPDRGRVHLQECHRLNRATLAGFQKKPKITPVGV